MSVVDEIRDHVQEHRTGMLFDLVFAITWVVGVTVVFRFLEGPKWAYYLTMALGVVAYYGFFWSLSVAKERKRDEQG